MHWRELKHASSDQRDFYWWEREQEAAVMRDTYARLGHAAIAAQWEHQRLECQIKRKWLETGGGGGN